MTHLELQQEELSAWDRVQLARHPQRPHTLDYVRALCSDFVELHGDRRFGDDPAIIGGIATFNERTVVVVGHQKGRDTRENLRRNFGMPKPEGYRKALRLFQQAEKFGFPLLCFIDTPVPAPTASRRSAASPTRLPSASWRWRPARADHRRGDRRGRQRRRGGDRRGRPHSDA